jgi:hypothetical protein
MSIALLGCIVLCIGWIGAALSYMTLIYTQATAQNLQQDVEAIAWQ